jgi:UDP-2,3-diacylglucosamine pyrophosphatase LpxH
MEAVVISDVHLGSNLCQARKLNKLLKDIESGDLPTDSLIINGDLFDDSNFHRLTKHHWHVLSMIRKLSDHIKIVHIKGNHELPTDIMSLLLGVDYVEEYSLKSGDKNIWIHHGDRYDAFLTDHPILGWFGDLIYSAIQKISHNLARHVKRKSKIFMRNHEVIKHESLKYARKHGYNAVLAGHTHYAASEKDEISYFNSGCWTELPCSYLTVADGDIRLHYVY